MTATARVYAQALEASSSDSTDSSLTSFNDKAQEKKKTMHGRRGPLPVVPASGTEPTQDPQALDEAAEKASEICLTSDNAFDALAKNAEEELGEILASCKEESMQTLSGNWDSCTDANKVVCAYNDVYRVFHWTIAVSTTSPIVVKTYDLQPYNNLQPDTLVYLVYLPNGYSFYRQVPGNVVAIDDNGNTETPCDPSYPGYPYSCWDSKIVYTPTSTGVYMVVVASKYQGSHGTATISIAYDGLRPTVFTNQFFGGYHIVGKEVRVNDILLVGKNSNAAGMPEDPEYHDSVLFYFTTTAVTCTSGSCGKMLLDDDVHLGTIISLSRLDVPSGYGSTSSRVLVGVYDGIHSSGNPYKMNVRFMHIRKHIQRGGNWSGASQMDTDGDGLTKEVEAILGSCDTATDSPQSGVGVKFMNCQNFGTLVNQRVNLRGKNPQCPIPPGNIQQDPDCWSPVDSDNDGLSDDWEVWAVGVKCSNVPTSPYYSCDNLAPISLLDPPGCPTGYYCTALALSALSDPDPTRHDLYYLTDFWSCQTCSPPHNHSVTSDQQTMLLYTWTYDPVTCFDGSLYWPNDPCPDPNDLPYYVAMHLYNGDEFQLPDDSADDYALPFGAPGTLSYFTHSFSPDEKYTRVFRYALATHRWGGAADGLTRRLVWGNTGRNDILTTFSHEAGHTLSLEDVETSDVNLPGTCPEDYKRPRNWQCNNPPPPNQRERAIGGNPNYPSLMSYFYARPPAGMRPKGAPPPAFNTPDFDQCSPEFLRFSKGLNPVLNEASLEEVYNQSVWWVPKFVSDLFCYVDQNHWWAVWGTPRINPYHPYCTGATCIVNWDALRTGCAQPNPPYQFDVSYGRYCAHIFGDPEYQCCPGGPQNCQGLAQCASDQLKDHNDWLQMVAIGKQSLRGTSVRDFAIYQDSYNGGAFGNYAGWPEAELQITGQVGFTSDKYPHNVCTSNGECPTGLCLFEDLCSSNADCLNGQECRNGVCTCSFHTDCYGAHCDASSGLCDVSYGVCSCNSDQDCPFHPDLSACIEAKHLCTSWYPANVAYKSPKQSISFTGPGSGSFVKLQDSYPPGPISTIGDSFHDTFEIRMDFKIGPLAPAQTQATLVRSNAFRVEIVRCTGGYCLRLYVANEPRLDFPSANVGAPLQSWRWYRMVWFAKKGGKHFVSIQPWDYLRGGYWDDIPGAGCVYRSYSATGSDMPAPGAVWIGYDGSSGLSRFYGLVDNFNLWNFQRVGMPEGCVEIVP